MKINVVQFAVRHIQVIKKYNDYNKDIEELKKLKIDRMKVSMQNGTYTDIDKSAREIELQEKLKSRNNKSKEYAESGFTARERKRYTNRKNRGTTWAKVIAVTIVIYFVCIILISFMSNVRF